MFRPQDRVPQLTQQVKPDDCIKILLATDNHIGYAEKDPVRGRDSINTFKEILDLAIANDVDMLLLAGTCFTRIDHRELHCIRPFRQ